VAGGLGFVLASGCVLDGRCALTDGSAAGAPIARRILLLAAVAVLLAGCGKKGDPKLPPQEESEKPVDGTTQ
jgi:predicted small lipoprotein YifL